MAFSGFLRQSTAVDILVGPFVDEDDGKTDEDALTISQGDLLLSKNGQDLAQKSDVTALSNVGTGYYNCELGATDTNTVGQLTVCVHETGALPVRLDYQVVEEAIYDAMYKSSATLQSDLTAIYSDTTVVATGVNTIESDIIVTDAVVDTIYSDTTAIATGVNTVESDIIVTDAVVDTIYSDTTAIAAEWANGGRLDLILDTIASDLIVTDAVVDTAYSDTTAIATGVNTIESDIIVTDAVVDTIYSDTTAVAAEWADGGRLDLILDTVASDIIVTDAVVDTTYSDTTAIATGVNTIESDIIVTDAVVDNVYSDTTILISDLKVTDAVVDTVYSDTTAIATGTNTLESDVVVMDSNVKVVSSDLTVVKTTTDNMDKAATTIVEGTVSNAVGAPTTTNFWSDDITEATADHFNGRIVIFTSGALQNQATDITDYALDTGEGKFTVTAMTEAPANDDTFVIV